MPRSTEPAHFQGGDPEARVEQGDQEILMHIKAWELLSSSASKIAGFSIYLKPPLYKERYLSPVNVGEENFFHILLDLI